MLNRWTIKTNAHTSVIGGCFDQEFDEWSNRLFDDFNSGKRIAVISNITLDELTDAPHRVQDNFASIPDDFLVILTSDTESRILADKYINENAVSNRFYEDATYCNSND